MSDYGFATYDGSVHNRRKGVVNSKWPIFGPKYTDISRCYKTFHLSDTTTKAHKVTFNGKVVDDWRISHSELMGGGDLVFEY